MDTQEKARITQELGSIIKEFRSYKRLYSQSRLTTAQERYLESLRFKLQRRIGKVKSLVVHLTKAQYMSELNYKFDFWDEAVRTGGYGPRTIESIDACIQACNEAIGKLDELDYTSSQLVKKTLNEEPPKAFIAHEGETTALNKLKGFLDALNVKYLIAEIVPSNGRLVEPQVTWTYGQSDFVIILATKGKAINRKTGKPYMGLNIADELGRAREAKKHIILLLQQGVEPHTNISGIVHERFTPQSMDKAFTKIARELRNWNYIKTGKAQG